MNDHKIDTHVVNRVEVITDLGRVYVNNDNNNIVEAFLQDEGRTLKIFIKNKSDADQK